MTKRMVDEALKHLTEETKKMYGNKLKEVILFGSCARGDFQDDSDVDIMILLDIPQQEINRESDKLDSVIHRLDVIYDYEMLFAPIVQSYRVFNDWLEVTPFYKAVKKEGIRYA